jgi:hypothetical protein
VGLDGFVYVSDSYNNRIVKLDGDDGGLVTEWGNEGIVGDGSSDDLFRYPNGVAVGPNGSVYVTNSGKNLIVQLDGDDGEIVTVWGTGGVVMADGKREPFSFPRGVIVKRAAPDVQFNSPRDVAVDLNGNVYVADMQNHRIVKLIDTSAPVSDVGNGSGGDCSDQSAFMAMIEDEGVGVDFGKVIDCAVLNQESLVKAGQLEEVRIEPQGRAGLSDNVKISFRTNNPVPEGGKVVVTFPENFEVGSDTSVVVNDVGDAANVESKDIPARSVTVVFNDQIEPGADVVLMLSDIKHPPVSGPPTEGGSVETQNSTGAPIDSCLHGNDGCTIGYTEVKPGFVTGLVFDLENEELDRADDDLLHTAAGSTGEIFVRFRTTNLVEMGDKVVVTFPEGFVVGSETEVTVNFEVGPDATVSDGIVTSSEGRTVDIYLWGEIQPGELVTLKLPDITNPPFTGQPQGGSIVTWDMDSWPGVEIDQSIDGAFDNEDDYHEACEAQVIASCEDAYVTVDRITPGKLTDNEVMLDNKKAGGTGPVTVTFRLDNPLPANGAIAVTFPKGFVLNSGGATEAHLINPDEGTVGVEVYEVDEVTTAVFFRNGTGDELKPEEVEPVVVQLTNIRSPQVSGQTHNFEIRTSLGK